MLPVKNTYLVDFTFQKDAGVINLSKVQGLASKSQTIEYIVDERLANVESLIPRVKDLVELDVESFLNLQYPAPTDDVELFLKWGNKFNASSKEAVVEIGFRVRDRKAGETFPKNFMFVVDVSGSMASDDRLEMVKNSLIEIVKNANVSDQMGLVIFSDDAQLVFPPKQMKDKQALIELIKVLTPTNGTNIYSGLNLGLEQLMATKKEGYVNRLVLLTDGYGGDDVTTTVTTAKNYVAKGLQISAIGVGPDYNEALLTQLASVGGGLLQMAGDPAKLQTAFLKEFEGNTNPIGDKVKIEMTFNDQLVYRQLIGYANEKVSTGKVQFEADQLFPNLQKVGLAKFDIINSTPEIEKQPLVVTMTYTDVKTKQQKVVKKEIYPEWSTATGLLDMTLDKNQKKIMMVAIANQCMKQMANAYEAGNKTEAEKAINDGVRQINLLFPNGAPVEMLDLMQKLNSYTTAFQTMKSIKVH
jgi:Ca-activated chloride channel family protein